MATSLLHRDARILNQFCKRCDVAFVAGIELLRGGADRLIAQSGQTILHILQRQHCGDIALNSLDRVTRRLRRCEDAEPSGIFCFREAPLR